MKINDPYKYIHMSVRCCFCLCSGLSHIGIQIARARGQHVSVIECHAEKEKIAKELGAHRYIDCSKEQLNDMK
jgi:D-arabinose 1-dehydrogenase-like Zn-dependent alcohol dehydrogenase